MKDIIARIEIFETKILDAIEKIRLLKEQNGILFKENLRLKEEINQLSKKVESHLPREAGKESIKSNEDFNDINIEQIKSELEKSIEEVEECIALIGV